MASKATSDGATATPSLADRITRDPAAPADAAQTDGAGEDQNGSALHEPEYEVEVKLADLQQDPNNPLFSLQKFEDLHLPEAALKGILAMNFRKPSKIQEKALPLLFLNPPKNFIGQSQSGTGKTAAFVLNLLNRVDVSLKQPQGLVLAPSRELARQIQGVVVTMAKFMPELKVDAAIPDPTRKGPLSGQIIVGTPGTVQDLIRKRWLNTQNLKVLVLDEADNMLDQQGLGDQCKRVRMLLTNKELQVTLFSATFPEKVMAFARLFAPEANVIQLRHNELTVEGIKQFFFDCDSEETKYNTLVQFYGLLTISSSIIFCKRRDTAQEIERRMTADGHQVAHLSAALEGAARDQVIDRFRSGAAKVLITTNVLSRGIDVSSVTMVVNYDIPEGPGHRADPETYLHRIGRTGRFGKVGVAVSFISDKHGWDMLNEISTHFGCQIEPLPTDDWDRVEDTVKRVIKSARAGKSTKEMQQGLPGDAMVDGAAA